ncbi:monofunctional biosynthetic peptidoglycan transglycosylase [Flavihumibacter solisilvae]|uniref:monofunctional biosynthetic peptidoglycan transglycosylase n=1 Tax=Flavihumibacter solisilvae TaxID=1349421 RepID=UPI001F07727E|nr:monofunctional biosynthetic peptidoglycan transglycosylase [Flavihumibacter solisilvae]
MIPRLWRFLKRLLLILFIGQLVYIIVLRWVNPPITLTQIGNAFSYGLKRDYVSRGEMSKNARLAVIASEDQMFADHSGFDWKSIEKAMDYNQRKPNRIRGASTISQQTAKNVFLWQGRSWIRKALETYFTFMIELVWGKERILEVYLNVIEMGPGVFGIEAASQHYFKKPASRLTKAEAARIAACLPNPKKFLASPAGRYVSSRSFAIQRQMNNLSSDPDIAVIIQ